MFSFQLVQRYVMKLKFTCDSGAMKYPISFEIYSSMNKKRFRLYAMKFQFENKEFLSLNNNIVESRYAQYRTNSRKSNKGFGKSIFFNVDARLLIRDVISIAIVFLARLLAIRKRFEQ